MNYRDAKFGTRELRIAEGARSNVGGEMVVPAGNGGVATVNGGDIGRISGIPGDIIKETVGHNGVCVGEVEKVINGEWLTRLLVAPMPLFRREMAGSGAEVATDEVLRNFHYSLYFR